MTGSLIVSELMKIKKTKIWLLPWISPLLAMLITFSLHLPEGLEGHDWRLLYTMGTSMHAMLLLPLMTGIFSGFVCRYEHQGGGWKQLFCLPVDRKGIYAAKYMVVMGLVTINQLLLGVFVVAAGFLKGTEGEVPLGFILKSLAGGWAASLPLAALTLWVAISWSSFAAPFALNVILTLPNLMVINSETFGPFYPWAQPALMMMQQSEDSFGVFVSMPSMFFAVIASLVIFSLGGLITIQRKVV